MTIERVMFRFAVVLLIVTYVLPVVVNSWREQRFSIEVTLPQLGAGIVAAFGVFAFFAVVRRLHTTREGADFRIVIADGHLRMYEPGRRGTQLVEVDLNCVRHIHWYVSTFSRKATVRVTLWNRESTFTLHAIDVCPDDPHARELGWFRGPDMLLQTDQHRRFIEYFEPRVLSGQVTSTLDLATLQPTRTNADHAAPGWIAFEDKLIYSPHMAETERRMRSE